MSENAESNQEQDNPTAASSSNPVGIFQVPTSTASRNFQNTQNSASLSNPVGIFQVATSTAIRNFQSTASLSNPVGIFQVATSAASANFQNTQNTASLSNPVGIFQVATSTAVRNFQNTATSSNPVGIFQVATSTAIKNFQNIDKFIWCRDYASDIIVALKESERRRLTLDYKSQQMSFRASLLLLMKSVTDSLSFSRTTLHLAVYLLDCFMDSYTIAMGKLNASALMCLLIAAKIEEIDKNVPKLSKFNELVGNVYATRDFKPVEIKILEAVDFDLMIPTIASYVEIYSNQLISFEDFLRHNARRSAEQSTVYPSYEAMAVETSALLFSISNVSLHDHRLVNHTPSVIGAACLAAARSIKKVEPLWTERLVNLTGYDIVTITPYMEALESLYAMYARKEVICESPDSGIASDSKSESEGDDCDLEMCHHYQPALKRRKIFN